MCMSARCLHANDYTLMTREHTVCMAHVRDGCWQAYVRVHASTGEGRTYIIPRRNWPSASPVLAVDRYRCTASWNLGPGYEKER